MWVCVRLLKRRITCLPADFPWESHPKPERTNGNVLAVVRGGCLSNSIAQPASQGDSNRRRTASEEDNESSAPPSLDGELERQREGVGGWLRGGCSAAADDANTKYRLFYSHDNI